MFKLINLFLEFTYRIRNKLLSLTGTLLFKVSLRSAENSRLGKNFMSNGLTFSRFNKNCSVRIGDNFQLNNGEIFNSIGRQRQCVIIVRENAELVIGSYVGISSSAIFCNKRIVIGNGVKIGGNVCIYDTDFHSLNPFSRRSKRQDIKETLSKGVQIGNDVFIGAHSTILKGVTIGDGAIVGACSVITKDVPRNEIWAGNPAKFIRHNSFQHVSFKHS